MNRSNHMCSRIGISRYDIAPTLATLTMMATQIQAHRDPRTGEWSVNWMGEGFEKPTQAVSEPEFPGAA